MIRASTRLFAVLGDPVAHSLSPGIQNAAFRQAGVDGVYVALRCESDTLPGLIRGLAQAGGGGNVTLPHKQDAARIVDDPTETVERTGACNTFWTEDGRLRGDNTDVAGFQGAVDVLTGGSAAGASVLLLGAGGAARAALVGLVSDGVERVVLWNRSVARARRLASELGGTGTEVVGSLTEVRAERFDLVVNATSLGLVDSDPLPVDPASLQHPGALLDLVYRPRETELVRRARAEGISAADGGEMLVRQGAEAFRRWWKRSPPLEVMREALERARESETPSTGDP
ncbi:MAG: shikimate dehydrogenase [Gemmatimonadota bacterium]